MQKMTFFLLSLLLLLAACTSNEVPASDDEIRSGSQVEQIAEVKPIIETADVEVVVVEAGVDSAETGPPIDAYPPPQNNESISAYPAGEDDDTFLPMISAPKGEPTLISTLRLEEIASGYIKPVHITHAGDSRLFVVEQNGYITILENGQMAQPPFLDIDARVASSGERGLLSAAFHPNFSSNGRFFVYYTNNAGDVVISEFGLSADPAVADADSERVLLTVEQPFANHNGGQLQFGPDGYLYIGLGDGGSGGDPRCHGLNRTTLLGSILRIDVDGAQPYAVPTDNPYAGSSEFMPEIWSWGWRNPWRFSFDSRTGDMFIADVGQGSLEEVNWESAESAGGLSYGWNEFEGTQNYDDGDNCDPSPEVPQFPVAEYGRSDGRSITGGYIYRGSAVPALWGNYLYADFATGNIWATVQSESGLWENQIVLASGLNVSSFGEGTDGELYLLHHGGEIYKVASAESGE